jgi:type III restriction enzyme|tara:strand:- start:2069 stop:2536 length:468 start_codon:yes stop_codon:yes gene_type:complete
VIQLKDYQQRAVDRLKFEAENLLNSSENEIIIFQSPTGSGKTIMVAEFLKKMVKEKESQRKFAFIWVSVRRLHDQSKEKLEKYYEDDRTLECSYFEELNDKKIDEDEILFINWHSINKKDINIFVNNAVFIGVVKNGLLPVLLVAIIFVVVGNTK